MNLLTKKLFNSQIKEYMYYNTKCAFQSFYVDIVSLLNDNLFLLSRLEYIKIKNKMVDTILLTSDNILSVLSNGVKLKELHTFLLLNIKLLLYYL
jgi:hypothetical protein